MTDEPRDTAPARPYTGGEDAERLSEPHPLARGQAIGRYVVLERVGAGGMGVVYAAFDPELDRRVALKLLREDAPSGEEADSRQRRLLREARAMAKLAHPNVIAVHDVGTIEGRVFLAMEFVAGPTLGAWLRQPRAPAEILRVFVQAGRGLAAAHAVGLVHRDFKPENVLVDQELRARVTDFGLARAASEGAGLIDLAALTAAETTPLAVGSPASGPTSAGSGADRRHDAVTRPGLLLGTPEYMAPEQYRGEATDARTDQFSFAVALFEALHREHPFAGDTPRALANAVLSGKLRPPKSGRVPAHVDDALARALSEDPERRFPSMNALLDALEETPKTSRRQLALLGLAAAGVLGLAMVTRATAPESALCTGAESALVGVWDDEQKKAIAAAFAASGAPFADDAWRTAREGLDAYAAKWVAARTEACVAARVRGVESDQLFTLRTRCLDERRGRFRALTELFRAPDRGVIEHAVEASLALPPVDACSDTAALTARVPPPDDPVILARVTDLRDKLARAHTLGEAGKVNEALAAARDVAEQAGELKYRPLEAEALLVRADLELEAGEPKNARDTLLKAVFASEAGHVDDSAAEGWAKLVTVSGGWLYDREEAARCEERARAALERSGKGGLAELLLLEGLERTYRVQKRYDEAERTGRAVLALAKKLFGEQHPRVAHALLRLGSGLRDQRRTDEAITVLRASVALHERLYGPLHPAVAEAVNALGIAQAYAGAYADALASYRRALAVREQVLGPDHPAVAIALVNVAMAMRREGQSALALALVERAIAIESRTLGADHPETADAIVDRGLLYEQLGRLADARADLARARDIYEQKLGQSHAEVARALRLDAHVLLGAAKAEEALSEFERARAIDRTAPGPESSEYASDITGAARAFLALGHPEKAVPLLEEALAVGEKIRLAPDVRGEARFALARALVRKDPARARELAEKAESDFGAGRWLWKERDRVTDWLAGAEGVNREKGL